jgi:hypothetical protein
MPKPNRYENWHSGVVYATIMSGCVVRWKARDKPYEVSASRNGVIADTPVMNVKQLDEYLELLAEVRSVHVVLSHGRGTSLADRVAIGQVYPSAPFLSTGPCPCARCAEESADDAAVRG